MSSLPQINYSAIRPSSIASRQTVAEFIAAGGQIERCLPGGCVTFERFVHILAATPGVYDVPEPEAVEREGSGRRQRQAVKRRGAYHYTTRARDR